MAELFPTYEIGSLPKLNVRVKALRGQGVSNDELGEFTDLAKRLEADVSEVT